MLKGEESEEIASPFILCFRKQASGRSRASVVAGQN